MSGKVIALHPADGSRRAEIADLGKVLGASLPNLTPMAWDQHELFCTHEGEVYHKFDEISIFHSPAAQQMVIAFYVAGKQVYWEPCPIPGFKGELTLTNLRGWQQVGVK